MRRLLGCGVAVSIGLCGANARAAEIRWSGDPACRREIEVSEQVEAMTERKLTQVDLADFELVVEPADARSVRLSLVTITRADGQRTSRELQGPSCAEVTDAAAVAIALAIGAPAGSESSSVEPVAPGPAAAPTPTPAVAVSPAQSKPAPAWAWSASANVIVDSSATPSLTVGGALRFGFGSPQFRAELEAGVLAPSETKDAKGRGGTFNLVYLAPLACVLRSLGRPVLGLCAGYELGLLSAEGEGVSHPQVARTLWQAPRVELGGYWPISGTLRLSARIGAALPVTRHAFVLDAPEPVYRPDFISLRAALGIELGL